MEISIARLQSWIIDETEKSSTSEISDVLVEVEIADAIAPIKTRNLADIIQDMQTKKTQSGNQSHNKTPAKQESISKMLKFLEAHNVMDTNGLHNAVMAMHRKLNSVRDDLKRVEPKLKELTEHIKQAGRYREHSEIYNLYNRQKPKDEEQFYESFRMQLTLYGAAKRHLSKHLNNKGAIPLVSWEKELKELTGEKKKLYLDYESLKAQATEVEEFKRLAEDILREGVQREKPIRSYSVER